VDESVVSECKPKLLEFISPYESKNIYNAYETGLFFRTLPTKSLTVKREKCTGGKMPKERLSVIVWEYGRKNGKASRDWKSSKTKMFQEPENNLPVIWRSNKKLG
jgi:hypothetical protein